MDTDTFYFEGPTALREALAFADRHPGAEVEHTGVVYIVVVPKTPDAPARTDGWNLNRE